MGISIQRNGRQQVLVWAMVGMLTGLFVSRALLSVTMVLFLATAIVHRHWRLQLNRFVKNPMLIALALLFFIPFVSGLWSSSTTGWLNVLRIKLPLLLLPLAFAGNWQLSNKQWRLLLLVFVTLTAAGCAWSSLQYLQNRAQLEEAYLRAKSIPTPFDNDHVRFSWVVAVAAATCVYAAFVSNFKRTLLLPLAALFAVYLHLLSARTGLFCFYAFALVFFALRFFGAGEKRQWVLSGVLLLLLPLAAWLWLPTFRNRVAYFLYDFSFISNNTYLPGGNDGNRVQAIKAGWSLLKNHPLGVGAGDVEMATHNWYRQTAPHVKPADYLLPSSEWLMYGAAAGWPGLILFSLIMLLPLALPMQKHRPAWMLLNGMAALSFLFDIGLEVQFGVFAYAFIVLCCWKYCHIPTPLPYRP